MLLSGPPGSGKSTLARACASECSAAVVTLSSGDDPCEVLTERAIDTARSGQRVVVVIDEAEAVCANASLCDTIDNVVQLRHEEVLPIAVVACATRPHRVNERVRRRGRLPMHARVAPLSESERAQALALLSHDLPLANDVNFAMIAQRCRGFTGADLGQLVREAVLEAASAADSDDWGNDDSDSNVEDMDVILHLHFERGLQLVQPSAVRAIAGETPKVQFGDVVGCSDAKHALTRSIVWPASMPSTFERLGIRKPRGVLLYGPPGTGKTTLARAAVAESGAVVVPLSCADVFAAGVGEGEAQLREAFARAKEAEHALVLLDEADGVASARNAQHAGSSSSKLLATLLSEMDGLFSQQSQVSVIACTNRQESLDAAILRPGRLDVHVHVGAPDAGGRQLLIRQALTDCCKGVNAMFGNDIDVQLLAEHSDGMTGAEIKAACTEAALAVRRRSGESVTQSECVDAISQLRAQKNTANTHGG